MANFRTLDLNLLRVFDQVMAERNLTRAARHLHMTQPAVSNALGRLRDALDDQLFTRSGYGVEPTPRALELWPAVSDALRQLESALVPGEFDPALDQRAFVLAMADATAASLVPGLVERMQAGAPGVSMRVLPLTTRDPRTLLEDGSIDLAVGFFPAVIADLTARSQAGAVAAYAHERLYDGRYVCVMRRDHPLAGQPLTLDLFCAAQHLLVSFSGRPYGFIDEALSALGRRRRVMLTVNQFFTAGRVVAGSDLLTVLPEHFLPTTGMAHELVARELPFGVQQVHVDQLWHHRQTQRPDHAWLRAAVATSARQFFADSRALAAAATIAP